MAQQEDSMTGPNSDEDRAKTATVNMPVVQQKPTDSFIAMIAKAIMSTSDGEMLVADIYQWILDNYPYYQTAKCAWRISVRHNLSVNECFIKGQRSRGNRGFYWSIHPLCVEDFTNGCFQRRQARRLVQHQNRTQCASQSQQLHAITTDSSCPAFHEGKDMIHATKTMDSTWSDCSKFPAISISDEYLDHLSFSLER